MTRKDEAYFLSGLMYGAIFSFFSGLTFLLFTPYITAAHERDPLMYLCIFLAFFLGYIGLIYKLSKVVEKIQEKR